MSRTARTPLTAFALLLAFVLAIELLAVLVGLIAWLVRAWLS
jgi:hypothetical protein